MKWYDLVLLIIAILLFSVICFLLFTYSSQAAYKLNIHTGQMEYVPNSYLNQNPVTGECWWNVKQRRCNEKQFRNFEKQYPSRPPQTPLWRKRLQEMPSLRHTH